MSQRIIRLEGVDPDVTWDEVLDKPEEFPVEPHQHEWLDINNEPDFAPLDHAHSGYAPEFHTHDWNSITNVPTFANWTPVFLYSGTAQFNQTLQQISRGKVKIFGDICFFHFTLQGSISGGSIGGFLRIGGLPVSTINLTAYTSFIPLSVCVGLNTTYKQAVIYFGASQINLTDVSNQPISWTAYTLGTALDIRGSGWYQIN